VWIGTVHAGAGTGMCPGYPHVRPISDGSETRVGGWMQERLLRLPTGLDRFGSRCVCAWPSPESSYVTYVTCLISPRCCHAHVMTKSALVCADPDTPCVPCEANTYAPMPGTRGQCPLCSEVANSGTIRDADVRVAPSPASCYASFLLRLRAASVRSDAYAWTVVWLCSTTHPLHART
jgi:hypothetical protein